MQDRTFIYWHGHAVFLSFHLTFINSPICGSLRTQDAIQASRSPQRSITLHLKMSGRIRSQPANSLGVAGM